MPEDINRVKRAKTEKTATTTKKHLMVFSVKKMGLH